MQTLEQQITQQTRDLPESASLSNKLCNTFFIGRRAEPALHRT